MTRDVLDRIRSSRLFDSDYYRKQAGLAIFTNPFRHFMCKGFRRGLAPSQHFWTQYYLRSNPDVLTSGANPLQHYMEYGWREGRWPNPGFDPVAFVEAHPMVVGSGGLPVEYCIDLYGEARWPRDGKPIQDDENIPVEALNAAGRRAWKALFDPAYYLSHYPDVKDRGTNPFTHFEWIGWREDRNPRAGFDLSHAKRSLPDFIPGKNALAELAWSGKARSKHLSDGHLLVFDTASEAPPRRSAPSLGVHFHCYYPEILAEFLPSFGFFPPGTALYVTVTNEADHAFLRNFVSRQVGLDCDGRSVEVRLVPNRGRDIAPFLVGCADIWEHHDLVLHLHSKVSPHIAWGGDWRAYLFDQLFGSKAVIEHALRAFEEDAKLGCLYPENFHHIKKFLKKDDNNPRVAAFMASFPGAQGMAPGEPFAAGSMAWFRCSAYREMLKRVDNVALFEEEIGQIDLTFAHVIERSFPLVAKAAGYTAKAFTTSIRRRAPAPPSPAPARDRDGDASGVRWMRDDPRIARNLPVAIAPLTTHFNPKLLNLHWIIPDFAKGAGGHMTIFRMVSFLERFGHRQTIWLQNPRNHGGPLAAHRAINEWYRPVGERVHVRFLPDDVRCISGDAVIATDCWTVYPAVSVSNVKERFYFIQDNEADFHPAGELRLVADATYRMGLAALCAGPWLHTRAKAHGMWARSWQLCADRQVYYRKPRATPGGRLNIALYARPYTPRRAVNLAFAALDLLHERGVDFEAHFYGEENLKESFAFAHVKHGILSPAELGDLYRASDIGVVFSTTNYSLVPLEMMACGLPVVELDVESTRAVFTNNEVSLATPTPAGIADAIERLIEDEAGRAEQSRRAEAFLADLDWEKSARMVEAAIIERLSEKGAIPIDPEVVCAPAVLLPRKASVFVPTFNAGSDIDPLLERLSQQITPFRYDILMIDSGSTDGTVEKIRRHASKGIRLHEIPNRDFQHGRTRNLGIEMTEGDHVAILTQDALPADEHWLAQLIGGFDRSPRVAGVIGRHLAYPQHGPFVARDLDGMFDAMTTFSDIYSIRQGLPSFIRPGSPHWQMFLQFYSDNNSALARSVWKLLPYPEIEWGEDQVWAWEMLKLGFEKVYVDRARVFHSHDFPPGKQQAVAETEGRFWGEYFGLCLVGDVEASIRIADDHDRSSAAAAGVSKDVLEKRQQQNRALAQGRFSGYTASLGR